MSRAVQARQSAPSALLTARPGLKLAEPGDVSLSPGPAALLQQHLDEALSSSDERWAPRWTVAFILLTCGGFWTAAAMAARALLT